MIAQKTRREQMHKLQHSMTEFFKTAKYFTEDVNMIQISQGYADHWLHSLSQTCCISIHEFQPRLHTMILSGMLSEQNIFLTAGIAAAVFNPECEQEMNYEIVQYKNKTPS